VTGRAVAGMLLAGAVSAAAPARPLIIAHRGASGHRPEHTIEAYTLAIEMGADVIEPDVVITKDGVLVARHENEIGGTTDAAEKFPGRKTTKQIDGHPVTGWFTEDFTLDELKTLRARERLPFRSHEYDGKFLIPSLEEVVDLAARQSRVVGRSIAVYPETKHPAYFRSIGLPLEQRLVTLLDAHGLRRKTDPVFIQSFEPASLQTLRPMTRVRLMQLLDEGAEVTPRRLAAIAKYADGIGPNKRLVVPAAPDGRLLPPTSVVRDAHAAGLFVHVWTMRSEDVFLSPSYGGDPAHEYEQFASLAVDGLFTDFPDVAAAVFRRHSPQPRHPSVAR
jgi:glycerophosphoryl diester phosphodiesterase